MTTTKTAVIKILKSKFIFIVFVSYQK
jgi:hypothetical protein